MNEHYTREALHVLELAVRSAVYHRQNDTGTEHLLVGLLKETAGTASHVLMDARVDPDRLESLIDRLIAPDADVAVEDHPGFSPRFEEVLERAKTLAAETGNGKAGTEHLLLAMTQDVECVGTRLLHTMGVDVRKLQMDTLVAMNVDGHIDMKEFRNGTSVAMPGAQTTAQTPNLDRFGRDLTQLALAGKLDPIIGREREILRVMQILSRRTKNNPCLIGEPGVGKTAIVEGLAQRIASGDVPPQVAGKRIFILDLSGMVAGSKYRGEFEERIKGVVREVSANKNVLLFIDELHTLIGAGGAEGALDASNILKPSLSRGEIQVIGATTISEYRKYIEKDAALERRFQPVTVEEPSEEESFQILVGLRPYYEKHHGVEITDEALHAAVNLSERYINDRRLPDKALDLIDEASARIRIRNVGSKSPEGEEAELQRVKGAMEEAVLAGDFSKAREYRRERAELEKKAGIGKNVSFADAETGTKKKPVVDENAIAEAVADWTKIPVARVAEAESKRLARLEKELHKRVIGQEEAVSAVASAIRRGRVGLKDPKRPIGSFLFLGPTGVGKTELSKAVAETVFGSEQNLIRVDMSEYMEKHSVAKIIGSPPGYVGHDDGGQLSEQVRRHPYSVILFDEIEKAHPDVFNILLQVLDDGHITDSHGRKVNFKNTCIIMTSNAGAQSIIDPKRLGFSAKDDAEKDYERMKAGVMDEVKRIFRPEFLNRIDEIIVFHPLTETEVEEIAGLLLRELSGRAASGMKIHLKFTPAARKYLAQKGYSQKYGARPLKREIQTLVENEMAEKVLSGEIREGDSVTVGVGGGELKFTASRQEKSA